MTPPVLEEVIGEKAVEAITGGRKREKLGPLGQVAILLCVVLAIQWLANRDAAKTQADAYNALVTKIVDQNASDQKANRDALAALGVTITGMKESNQALAETIRAAFFVSRGADAPAQQRQARRSGP